MMGAFFLQTFAVATTFALGASVVPFATGPMQLAQAPNVVRLEARTPHLGFNRLLVSITLCEPTTAHCANVDDVMVDTGSTGLRLEASALPPGFDLPDMAGPDGRRLAECVRYLHDAAWGKLHRADLHIGGMTASALPVQVIAKTRDRPASCPDSDVRPTSNGTLGIGPHLTDCGGSCVQSATQPTYYTCADGLCVSVPDRVEPAYRLPNPVARFAGHANGIVIDLPVAPAGGALSLDGTLTFGVGTATNNGMDGASIIAVDHLAYFATRYAGRLYPESYIDSGTETYLLPDDRLPRCRDATWAFCAVPERQLEATIVGGNSAAFVTPFRVGDWDDVRARHVGADSGMAMAAPIEGRAFVWGAPFFFGKRVFIVMEGQSVPDRPQLAGPFYAFR